MFTKAFKFHEVKADAEQGKFTGRASVYGVVDLQGDVVMPGAFTKTLGENGGRIKVLNQHNPYDVIGMATLEDKDDALWVSEAKLSLGLPSAQEAFIRLKDGLIDGISIGYEVVKQNYEKGVRKLQELKLWEVSVVTFPANQFARVNGVKSLAEEITDLTTDLKNGKISPDKLDAAIVQWESAVAALKSLREPGETERANATADVETQPVVPAIEPEMIPLVRTVDTLIADLKEVILKTTR